MFTLTIEQPNSTTTQTFTTAAALLVEALAVLPQPGEGYCGVRVAHSTGTAAYTTDEADEGQDGCPLYAHTGGMAGSHHWAATWESALLHMLAWVAV